MTPPRFSDRPLSPEYEAVLAQQQAWAERRGYPLTLSRKALLNFDRALFVPLDVETTGQLEAGAGGELRRLNSLRSSATLALNVFLPWKTDPSVVAGLLGAAGASTGLRFEAQYPTGASPRHPHLDVLFESSPTPIAVESKFLEPYDEPQPQSMSSVYLEREDLWAGLPGLRQLAEIISVDGLAFERMGAAQLIKHILGLSKEFALDGFRLIYLWYRVPGPAADAHEVEIERFSEVAAGEVDFVATTYQELMDRLGKVDEPMPGYLEYLRDRYFPAQWTLPRLISRATDPAVNRATTLSSALSQLNVGALFDEYHDLMAHAPRRGLDGYSYFVPRTGAPSSLTSTNRREEQLAMALVNGAVALTTLDETIDLLMYAFPLYTKGGPRGMRGVDIVGHSPDTDRFWAIELKVAARQGRGDSPMRALFEALTYGAVIEANAIHIAAELAERFGRSWDGSRPGLVVAAPSAYWSKWAPNNRTGDWWTEYIRVIAELKGRLEAPIRVVDLGEVDFETGVEGRPRLVGEMATRPVSYA